MARQDLAWKAHPLTMDSVQLLLILMSETPTDFTEIGLSEEIPS